MQPKVQGHDFRVAYFRSGWAFFIPYLLLYLLYAWLKWPVNPDGGRSFPSLLHLYWVLHAFHLVLGSLTLREWWTKSAFETSRSPEPLAFAARFLALMPWLFLALIFYIPGIYLEWPSDPWEHLRRINEWRVNATVGAHSSWTKSSYFIPYSLLQGMSGLRQLFWLDFYYTGICLLLCWQYFRLARACGLEERASMIFVILQSLLMGNNVFSFYRYYGLSSTLYAQIGAVALTRVFLEVASRGTRSSRTLLPTSPLRPQPSIPWLLVSGFLLFVFTFYTHRQGLGIAALGITAIVVWRLIAWKRPALWWLTGATIIFSVASVLAWPRAPAIDVPFHEAGILTAWHGFNLFTPNSMTTERSIQILGVAGLANLLTALWLVSRNHVVGWITLGPVIALCCPFVAIPLANAFAENPNPLASVGVFHRMFFAIPEGLAIVVGADYFARRYNQGRTSTRVPWAPLALVGALLALMVLPPDQRAYNRTWQLTSIVPADLALRDIWASAEVSDVASSRKENPVVTTALVSFMMNTRQPTKTIFPLLNRVYEPPLRTPASDLESIRAALAPAPTAGRGVVLLPTYPLRWTAVSFAGLCSQHWLNYETSLAFAGTDELRLLAQHRAISHP